MKRYKIVLLVPHETVIEAPDMQAAHEEGKRMTHVEETLHGTPTAILQSVEYVGEVEADFDSDIPPAA